MFWRFGGYAQVSTIDTLLEKQDVTLEELLSEGDLIQELKSHNTKLIEYLREDSILEKLLEYVVATKLEPIANDDYDMDEKKDKEKAEPEERVFGRPVSESGEGEDQAEKDRNRYAYVAAEILSSDSWSLTAALLENESLLRKFWKFLERPVPLDPLQAGYFTKVNEALFDKKTEEMLELFKSIPDVIKNMMKHVDSPMIMDLLLKIISLEKAEGGAGIADWLHSQNVIPILLSYLGPEHAWSTQTSAGDFLKAIITISANASQNEQSCIGPNQLTRQLVSEKCIAKLIQDMLHGGNPLTVGVGIVIEVIRKNNSDYDPEVGADSIKTPSSRDPIYLGSLLGLFAKHIPDFVALMLSKNHTIGGEDGPVTIQRKELSAAFGGRIEPLGFDRFKTCELMAELLHCSNMGLLNEVGAEALVKARDVEREKLRAEGKLAVSTNRHDIDSDGITIRSPNSSRLGSNSPEDLRRLEIQNGSDDDGFEEVTHSQDIDDDVKDEFDEKNDDMLDAPKSGTFSSFMEKDTDDFVDEPLSSPRLGATDVADPSLIVKPLSPTKQLSEKIDDMKIDDSVDSKSTPSKTDDKKEHVDDGKSAVEKAVEAAVAQVTEKMAKAEGAVKSAAESLTPHPDDKPKPLFAAKKDQKKEEKTEKAEEKDTFSAPASAVTEKAAEVPLPADTTVSHDEDSTIVDHGAAHNDDTQNIVVGQAFDPESPVVGDYLKMQFVEHNVVPTILDFFFRFPWNNFLHNVVYDVVQQVFNGPMDRGFNRTLAIDVFKTGKITARIVEGQRKSDETQARDKMRLGYMGHLTLIAEEVVKFCERHPPEVLSDTVIEQVVRDDWHNYVDITLTETRERDNAILGGVRPDQSIGGRGMSAPVSNTASSALADAGLNGSTGLDGMDFSNGTGALNAGFGVGGTSLLSGFGSSSDEEDDEMDEDVNDGDREGSGGLEFSKFISTPSTTTATSDSVAAPENSPDQLGFAPPPPLNIPPSRARRQLAARLALHNQSQDSASDKNGDENLSTSPENKSGDNRDPFADDDSDDDLEIEGGPADHDAWGLPSYSRHAAGKKLEGFEDNFVDDHVGAPSSLSDPDLAPLARVSSHGDGLTAGFVPAALPLSSAFEGHIGTLSESEGVLHGDGDEEGADRDADLRKPRSISPLKTGFSSLWPFGSHASRGHTRKNPIPRFGKGDGEELDMENDVDLEEDANEFFKSDTDSDDGFDGVGEREASGEYERKGRGRRPSLTTEAKSRTSLEDDDEDAEVVVKKEDDTAHADKDKEKRKEVEKKEDVKEDVKEEKDQDKKI